MFVDGFELRFGLYVVIAYYTEHLLSIYWFLQFCFLSCILDFHHHGGKRSISLLIIEELRKVSKNEESSNEKHPLRDMHALHLHLHYLMGLF